MVLIMVKRIEISHPGSLKDLGYNEEEDIEKQKIAIKKADELYGVEETNRKLTALESFSNRFPDKKEKIRELIEWNKNNE